MPTTTTTKTPTTNTKKTTSKQPAKQETPKKKGFANAIVNAFESFVKTFKKHGFFSVTLILILFLLFYSVIMYPVDLNNVVNNALEQSEKNKQELLEKSTQQRLNADRIVMNIMNNLVQEYNVDRCMLLELHNSTTNISGVEFFFLSATYEIINPNDTDIEYIGDNFQRQHLLQAIGEESLEQMKYQDYLYFSNLDQYHKSYYRLLHKLRQFGAKSIMLIPFCSNDKPLLIMVLVSNDAEMNAQRIYNYVKTFKREIEQNLMVLE